MSNRRVSQAAQAAKHILSYTRNLGPVDADAAAQELVALYTNHGRLTAELVLEAARDAANPLHEAFEWDDSAAAHQYRLHQASTLIRAVKVVSPAAEPHSVFVRVSAELGYQPMDTVVSVPDMFDAALNEARKRIDQARDSLDELQTAASEHPQRVKKIAKVVRAVETARQAANAIH